MTVNKRIVKCQVTDEYVIGAGVHLGAEGSHDDVLLELTFSDLWQGLTKSITWWNALGEPVRTILTIEHIDVDNTNVYRVPVPAEAKAVAGDMEVTIKGVQVENEIEERATVSVTAQFKVLPGKWAADASEVQDVTPTHAEQIQAGIDKVMGDIISAVKASESAQESKKAAAGSAAAAAGSETAAKTAQAEAESARDAAKVSETNAKSSETAAKQSETAAKASEAATAQSASAAKASQTAAKESETAAKTSEDNAKTSEVNAKSSETAAKSSETAAKASETAAKSSENAAKTAKDKAEAAQAAAEKAKNEAEGIAGGDFATNERVNQVETEVGRVAQSVETRVQPINLGGTGATTAAQALANLGGAAKDLSNVELSVRFEKTAMPTSANWQSVTYGNGKFVAVASDSNIAACSITINFIESLTDFGYSKIEVGSYVGTGTYGTMNRCSLTFSSTPKIVFIKSSGESKVMILFYGHTWGDSTGSTSNSSEPQTTWNGNKVTWYTESSANVQFNSSGETYDYLAFF